MTIENFKQIVPEDYKLYKNYLRFYNNSESSFATMYMWQHYFDVKYYAKNNVLYSLYKNKNDEFNSFMPYGNNRNSHEVINNLLNLYQTFNQPLIIKLCTQDFVDFVVNSKKYSTIIKPVENSFDYVYRTQDLINLSGKKYHSKKNHINTFNKKYSYEYISYNDSFKESCIEFCKKTLSQYYDNDIDSYKTELFSIEKTFDNINELNLKCGLLTIDDNIIALSVGEKLNDEYALIHIEKADYNYRTAYSVINNLFLKNEFADTVYVNREEDMGIEGLRKAKESYHPSHYIKKYNIEFI